MQKQRPLLNIKALKKVETMTGRMHFNQLALLYTVTKIPYDSDFL